jgi:TPR repeat protein
VATLEELKVSYGNEIINTLIEKFNKEDVEATKTLAEWGFAKAQMNLGVFHMIGRGVENDKKKAFDWVMKAANQGMAGAMDFIATSYKYGDGVDKDIHKAIEWYQKAIEHGYLEAYANIGLCYFLGSDGIAADNQKAVYWWRKGASQGNSESQYRIGMCYCGGHGLERDIDVGRRWLEEAASHGNKNAIESLKKAGIM